MTIMIQCCSGQSLRSDSGWTRKMGEGEEKLWQSTQGSTERTGI